MKEERKRGDSSLAANYIPFDTILTTLKNNPKHTYLEGLSHTYYIELKFDNEDDLMESKASVKQYCLFEFPCLDHDFKWVQLIGQGS